MRIGRPSKLTPERRARIITLLEQGVFPEAAVQSVGVHPATYYAWMAKGRAEREAAELESEEVELSLGLDIEASPSDYREFCEAVELAIGLAQAKDELRLASMAAAGSVTAQIERMKRRWRGTWGDRVDVVASHGPENGPYGPIPVGPGPEHEEAGWSPDTAFATRVAGILARAGKLPEEAVDDVAAALIAAPEPVPADGRADGPAVDPD